MSEREPVRFYCGVCGEATRSGIAWHCDGCGAHHPVRFLACEVRGRVTVAPHLGGKRTRRPLGAA